MIASIWILGIVPNKPYTVFDEINRTYNPVVGIFRYESKYKIRDDYGNLRWVDSHYFFEMDEWRQSKINKIID
jgi:hypothetical protein